MAADTAGVILLVIGILLGWGAFAAFDRQTVMIAASGHLCLAAALAIGAVVISPKLLILAVLPVAAAITLLHPLSRCYVLTGDS